MKIGEIITTNTGVKLQAIANLLDIFSDSPNVSGSSCTSCYFDKLRGKGPCIQIQRDLGVDVRCRGNPYDLYDTTSLIVLEAHMS